MRVGLGDGGEEWEEFSNVIDDTVTWNQSDAVYEHAI